VVHFERIRDVISGPFSPEVIRQRMAAGWQLVSIEWRRELPESEAPTQAHLVRPAPADCASRTIASAWRSIPSRIGRLC
jgi:hypothetical protein